MTTPNQPTLGERVRLRQDTRHANGHTCIGDGTRTCNTVVFVPEPRCLRCEPEHKRLASVTTERAA